MLRKIIYMNKATQNQNKSIISLTVKASSIVKISADLSQPWWQNWRLLAPDLLFALLFPFHKDFFFFVQG